jgi:hypothetical protein
MTTVGYGDLFPGSTLEKVLRAKGTPSAATI